MSQEMIPSTQEPIEGKGAEQSGTPADGVPPDGEGAERLHQIKDTLQQTFGLFRRGSIRTRLLWASILTVLLAAAVIIITSVIGGLRSGEQQIVAQLESVATLKEAEIETWASRLHTDLSLMFHEHEAEEVLQPLLQGAIDETALDDLRRDLQHTRDKAALFEEVFVLDPSGMVLLSTDASQEGKIYANEAFFQQGLFDRYLHPPAYSPSLGRVSVIFSQPLTDEEGNAIGVLAGRASMARLNEIMVERAGLGDTGETYLIGSNHALLTAARFDEDLLYVRTDAANAAVDQHRNGSAAYTDYRGQPVIGVYRWLPDLQVGLLAEQDRSEAFQGTYRTMALNVALAGVAVIGASVASLFITRSIANPLMELAETASAIAAGNLERRAQVQREDEIGTLGRTFNAMTTRLRQMLEREREQREYLQSTVSQYMDFVAEVAQGNLTTQLLVPDSEDDDDPLLKLGKHLNTMVDNLRHITAQIRDGAHGLHSASSEIMAASSQQAAGANEQSAAISQASTTIDEVRTIADETSRRAQGVAEQAQRTAEVAESGRQAVADTISGMQQVKDTVETIATNILQLSEQAQAIGQIISTVNEIAAQSNILALNAAVEAARAGEAGKGFAVVAQEVRSLAEQSRVATDQVRGILSEIQRGVNAAVMATEEGMKMADTGVGVTRTAGEAIRRLAEGVTESAQAAGQIAAAANQQLTGMEQIATAMENIHQATAQSLGGVQQVEGSVENLTGLAQDLTETVGQYEL